MKPIRSSAIVLPAAIAALLVVTGCNSGSTKPVPTHPNAVALLNAPPLTAEEERRIYRDGARTAWAYFERFYQPATGLAWAHHKFEFTTMWDAASLMGATWSARELGLISQAVYDQRIRTLLTTLNRLKLVDGIAFNTFYAAKNGEMVGEDAKMTYRPTSVGTGYSVTDLGRLLVWLKILSNQPQHTQLATTVVRRLNMAELVRDGLPRGMVIKGRSRYHYPETAMGYLQYATAGFALWGQKVSEGLDVRNGSSLKNILGQRIYVDDRDSDKIVSEPFMMMGLETGWFTPDLRQQTERVLAAQEERFRRTGIITLVSEDALPDPPFFFYYYSLYRDGDSFVVDGPGPNSRVDQPRWVSAKAAFAWHALLPSPYTTAALRAVQPAAIPGIGWGSGVYEKTLRPTGEPSLNTAALILEAAAYKLRGRPFLSARIQ
ncbi:MAG: DUF3131 domain-containing protein [Gemmatimonadaceae bacterium]